MHQVSHQYSYVYHVLPVIKGGCRGRDRMLVALQQPMQSLPITIIRL
jgi:hypothetical protein